MDREALLVQAQRALPEPYRIPETKFRFLSDEIVIVVHSDLPPLQFCAGETEWKTIPKRTTN